ncbi:uncharacterized protein LOC102227673 isoform X2 [Xiphophorus maculatus]|uniref:uncharacterized protein LOC102227673 isoform X2 n=1 Tax=Xiphophorus maculatus TaxID=8083 RepID=UPI000C6E5EF6|nr:uncharacterized protein LOC102227673 isoform X2 [Xiphophorus maculatus]
MFPYEMQILQQLAVLGNNNFLYFVVCCSLATGQISSRYFFIQEPMPWAKGREYCQSHFVDLAVLSTEKEYFALLSAIPANNASFWLGLHKESSGWKWTNGEQLRLTHWYNYNQEGHCVSLEAMFEEDDKLLARSCNEQHRVACQGPVSPQSVAVYFVNIDHLNLSWNISALMQTTSHYYNVTICSFICETLSYPCTNGSSLMSISISNLSAATEYFIYVSAVVIRIEHGTSRKWILQDDPTMLKAKTATSNKTHKILFIVLDLFSLVLLVSSFWYIYIVAKKDKSTERVGDRSSADSTIVVLLPHRIGLEKLENFIF